MEPPFAPNSRVAGAKEHCIRARLFLRLANQQQGESDAYRLRIAAISACRAIVEIMLEAAETQEVAGHKSGNPKADRDSYEITLAGLPHYKLIEHIRIHDFHRFGLIPTDKAFQAVFVGGPIKMTAQRGGVSIVLGERGLEVTTSGNSRVHMQRILIEDDGKFLDEQLGRHYPPEAIVDEFLKEVCSKIEEFEGATES
ncbi:MAG: hypothetical protein PSV46_16570 [Reyranella sp.]|nr:hypothetical protein [Reyranella sp.]